jgi:hypothetical protein
MKVFLSWSGPKSRAVTETLKKYLPSLINEAEPWLSTQEIEAGARWSAEIAKNLEISNIGICCLTAENQNAPWILFEAGAIAKLTTIGRAIVLRIDLRTTEITGPLSQFQSLSLDQEDIWKMVGTINKSGSPPVSESTLRTSFDALWPQIDAGFKEAVKIPSVKPTAERSSQELLEEILDLSRRQHNVSQDVTSRLALIDLRLEHAELSQTSPGVSSLYGQASAQTILNRLPTSYDRLIALAGLNPIYRDPLPTDSRGADDAIKPEGETELEDNTDDVLGP